MTTWRRTDLNNIGVLRAQSLTQRGEGRHIEPLLGFVAGALIGSHEANQGCESGWQRKHPACADKSQRRATPMGCS